MRHLFALPALLLLLTESAVASPIQADVLWVIDDTISMAGDMAEVKDNIVSFNTAMIAAGIDAQYGLVRYGGPNNVLSTYGHNDIASLEQDIEPFATFNQPGGPFQTLAAGTSNLDPGSEAIAVGLNGAMFRPDSIINIILITDEPDSSSSAQFLQADSLLTQYDALFHAVARPGSGNSDARYGALAANHGGAYFDILAFRNNPTSFFDQVTQANLDKMTAVPEPSSMLLFGLGLIGVGAFRGRILRAGK